VRFADDQTPHERIAAIGDEVMAQRRATGRPALSRMLAAESANEARMVSSSTLAQRRTRAAQDHGIGSRGARFLASQAPSSAAPEGSSDVLPQVATNRTADVRCKLPAVVKAPGTMP
jgi:hypothetical protein